MQGNKEGQTIYIVEGEKDVETLKKYRKIATCNTHGAGEGKWLNYQYNDYLINAYIVIIQDNDNIGKAFAKEIAESLVGKAKSIKLIDLTRQWTELSDHGDITDIFTVSNDDNDVLKNLDNLIATTPEYISQSDDKSLHECDAEFKDFFKDSGYTSIGGNTNQIKLCREGDQWKTEYKPLCNFVARCVKERAIDDGIEIKKTFSIVGKHANGRVLPEINVSVNDFNSMNWVTKLWGFSCNLNPGTIVKDKLRHCIQQTSQDLKSEIIYTSVTSPKNTYAAEVIDNDQGALGGVTYVYIQNKSKPIDLFIGKFKKIRYVIYSGEYGEFESMQIYWKDEHTIIINGKGYDI